MKQCFYWVIFSSLFFSMGHAMELEKTQQNDLNNQLLRACHKGDKEEVSLLLQKGAEINGDGESVVTPLTVAITHSLPIAAMLLNMNANAGTNARTGFSPLYCALRKVENQTHLYLIQKLLQAQAPIESKLLGPMLLAETINDSSPALFNLLLDYGADPKGGYKHEIPMTMIDTKIKEQKYQLENFKWIKRVFLAHKNNYPVDQVGRRTIKDEEGKEIICCTCFSKQQPEFFSLTDCQHKFCTECLKARVRCALTFDDELALSCPAKDCRHLLSKEEVKTFSKNDANLLDIFDQYTVSIKCNLCTLTKKKKDFVSLSCTHSYCKECLKARIRSAINNLDEKIKLIKCPTEKCSHKFLREEIKEIGPEDPDLLKILEETRKCGICCSTKWNDKFCELSCKHWFCQDCLEKRICEAAKNPRREGVLSCPQKDCSKELDKTCFSLNFKWIFDIVENEQLILRQPEKYKRCPMATCQTFYQCFSALPENISCPLCRHCPGCQKNHTQKMKCSEHRFFLDLPKYSEEEDEKIFNDWGAKNLKACPCCKNLFTKDGTCNFVICNTCANYFCWECLEPFGKAADDASKKYSSRHRHRIL